MKLFLNLLILISFGGSAMSLAQVSSVTRAQSTDLQLKLVAKFAQQCVDGFMDLNSMMDGYLNAYALYEAGVPTAGDAATNCQERIVRLYFGETKQNGNMPGSGMAFNKSAYGEFLDLVAAKSSEAPDAVADLAQELQRAWEVKFLNLFHKSVLVQMEKNNAFSGLGETAGIGLAAYGLGSVFSFATPTLYRALSVSQNFARWKLLWNLAKLSAPTATYITITLTGKHVGEKLDLPIPPAARLTLAIPRDQIDFAREAQKEFVRQMTSTAGGLFAMSGASVLLGNSFKAAEGASLAARAGLTIAEGTVSLGIGLVAQGLVYWSEKGLSDFSEKISRIDEFNEAVSGFVEASKAFEKNQNPQVRRNYIQSAVTLISATHRLEGMQNKKYFQAIMTAEAKMAALTWEIEEKGVNSSNAAKFQTAIESIVKEHNDAVADFKKALSKRAIDPRVLHWFSTQKRKVLAPEPVLVGSPESRSGDAMHAAEDLVARASDIVAKPYSEVQVETILVEAYELLTYQQDPRVMALANANISTHILNYLKLRGMDGGKNE